ncbi:MAG: hypothetical protein HYR91_08835 [Flavobacteriia bacterium]|nr:hypothetical protein [Flavobacteriia bacterium]
MYSFEFENITPITSFQVENSLFEQGIYLWIWHANKIPPHIGISENGCYYSLKVNGKDEGLPLKKVKNIIVAKKIGVFIVELKEDNLIKNIPKTFSLFEKAVSNQTSCLTPIQELLGFSGERMILAQLLNKIRKNNTLGEVFSINLECDFNGILAYGNDEIEARLKHLENVKRNKGLY